MSARLRVIVGRGALVAFLAAFAAPWLAGLHLRLVDDDACGPSALGPRHRAAQFEATRTAPTPTHCVACHWMRALTGAAPAPALSPAPPLAVLGLGPGDHVWWFGASVPPIGPSRAPPTSL